MKTIALALILCLMAGPAAAVGPIEYAGRMGEKLAFGVADVVYSPVEIPIAMFAYTADFDKHDGPDIVGTFVGFLVGTGHTLVRALRGSFDIATFQAAPAKNRTWEWTIDDTLPLTRRVK